MEAIAIRLEAIATSKKLLVTRASLLVAKGIQYGWLVPTAMASLPSNETECASTAGTLRLSKVCRLPQLGAEFETESALLLCFLRRALRHEHVSVRIKNA